MVRVPGGKLAAGQQARWQKVDLRLAQPLGHIDGLGILIDLAGTSKLDQIVPG